MAALIFAALHISVLSMLNLSTVVFEINIDIWSFALNGDAFGIVKHKWYSHITVNVLRSWTYTSTIMHTNTKLQKWPSVGKFLPKPPLNFDLFILSTFPSSNWIDDNASGHFKLFNVAVLLCSNCRGTAVCGTNLVIYPVLKHSQRQMKFSLVGMHQNVKVFQCFLSELQFWVVGQDSIFGIATCFGLDGPGIESRWGRDFLHTSRLALAPTQPPVQWVPGLSRG